MSISSVARKAVVVEGKTDLHVILHLLRKIDRQIVPCEDEGDRNTVVVKLPGGENLRLVLIEAGSIDSLCDEIELRVKSSELERVGIVFDADAEPKDRWRKVRKIIIAEHSVTDKSTLEKAIPGKPVPGGMWIPAIERGPIVGMWMMPDNKSGGAIETFLAGLISPEDICWKHAGEFVEAVSKATTTFPPHKAPKAKIHSWLAVQREPGQPPGVAISRYFNVETPEALEFRAWLEQLAA